MAIFACMLLLYVCAAHCWGVLPMKCASVPILLTEPTCLLALFNAPKWLIGMKCSSIRVVIFRVFLDKIIVCVVIFYSKQTLK